MLDGVIMADDFMGIIFLLFLIGIYNSSDENDQFNGSIAETVCAQNSQLLTNIDNVRTESAFWKTNIRTYNLCVF